MAEETAPEVFDHKTPVASVDMDVENGGEVNQKRAREEEEEKEAQDDAVSKKQKVDEDKSVEEQRLEKLNEDKEEKDEASVPVKLGYKSFESSVDMFTYFYNFLHYWPQYLNVNKYEHMMLLRLLKNGHADPDKKIGGGIQAFQVRKHPTYNSRCFFLIREDDSSEDFSFRKCVDHILPLPDEIHLKSEVKKGFGGGGGGGGKHHGGKGGRGGGHGRGGKWRR